MKSMKAKKLAIVLCAAIAIAGAGIGTTVSYLTDKDAATNKFTLGKVDITLTEDNYKEENSTDVMPGDVFAKDPTIKNNQENCYMRVKVSIIDKATGNAVSDEAAKLIWDTIKYTGTPGGEVKDDTKTVNLAFKPEGDLSKGSEIFYYTNGGELPAEFKKGSEPVVLFDTISIPTSYDNDSFKTMGDYDIKIEVEAIQSKNIEADGAKEAFGDFGGTNIKEFGSTTDSSTTGK